MIFQTRSNNCPDTVRERRLER
ncbi:hypothetical protein [Fusicatenibacter sp.]